MNLKYTEMNFRKCYLGKKYPLCVWDNCFNPGIKFQDKTMQIQRDPIPAVQGTLSVTTGVMYWDPAWARLYMTPLQVFDLNVKE